MSKIQGSDVGTIRVRKGTCVHNGSEETIHVVALADIKHVSLMLAHWSTTLRSGHNKKRKVGSELAQFQCGEAQNNYYEVRNAVDDNNNNR